MPIVAEAPSWPGVEVSYYARSPRTLFELGRLATAGSVGEEQRGIEALAHADFLTAVAENLRTDQELSPLLDVERTETLKVKYGQAVAADGEAMVDKVQRGLVVAQLAVAQEPRMHTQVVRNEGDVYTANVVDSLSPSELYTVISMDPKDAWQRDKQFLKELGYREGLAFIQFYYKPPSGDRLIAGSFSVGNSSKEDWRIIQARHSVNVPLEVSADEWIRYSIRRSVPEETALSFAAQLRDEYYGRIGLDHKRYSVTEFLQAHETLVWQYFELYIRPLAQAIYTGVNNDVMVGLAQRLLRSDATDKLPPAARQTLLRVGNSRSFSTESGQVMENLIRYALVEELRQYLVGYVGQGSSSLSRQSEAVYIVGQPIEYQYMHDRLERHIRAGALAARNYGGCASLQLVEQEQPEAEASLQEAYGGKARGEGEPTIPARVRCIKCRQESAKEDVIQETTWRCPKCGHEVDCTGRIVHDGKPASTRRQNVGAAITLLGRRHQKGAA